MYFWIGIVFSTIGFIVWIWYEAKHKPFEYTPEDLEMKLVDAKDLRQLEI